MNKAALILMLCISIACNRSEHKLTENDHETESDGIITIQSTNFTDSVEFFTEYQTFVAGEESEVLVHVTLLQNYKPLEAGSVTISLDGDTSTANLPLEPGIFLVHITPQDPGTHLITCRVVTDQIDESFSTEVTVQKDHVAVQEDTEPEGAGTDPGEISFLKEQAWKVDFMVDQINPGPFSTTVKTGGEIMAMPGEKTMVASSTAGIIIFSKQDLVQGSKVSKGELLFTISGKALDEGNAGMKYQQYLIDLERSKLEYERQKKLYDERVVSEKQMIESRSRYQSDSLRFYNLAATASRDGLKVFAPEAGYIHELNVTRGQYVETGEIVVTVSSNKLLLLRADLPQQFFNILGEIESANFRTAYSDQYYHIEELGGRLLAKGASVAENDHYMPVYFEVINDGSLLEGAYAEFNLVTGKKENRLSVPVSAILEEQGASYLYIQLTGEKYSKRAVKVGGNNGERIEILSGLKPGERVVTRGIMILKAASMVTAGDTHQHIH